MATGPGETFGYFLKEDPNTTALPLPLVSTDRLAVVRGDVPDETTYYLEAGNLNVVSATSYVVAAEGGTTTATEGLGGVQLEPAAALAAYTVVLPPNPVDEQTFGISTTEDITALLGLAPGLETVLGGVVGVLAANGGVAWRYRLSNTTWYRI